MIRSVTITNHVNESITLELTHPEKTGFIITSIDGLGPVKSSINVTELVTSDGGLFNSARTSSRNIVFHLQYMTTDKEGIEDIRHKTYKYFPVKKQIEICIETDKRTSKIFGYVESNEPDMFNENESCSISVICPNPYFYSLKEQCSILSNVEANFEFEFENKSLIEPTIEISKLLEPPELKLLYEGDVDTGITLIIRCLNDYAKNIKIYNTASNESISINSELEAGSILKVCTVVGKKSATLIKNGFETNAINVIDRNSKWFKITKGINILSFDAEYGVDNIEIIIGNDVLYGGI